MPRASTTVTKKKKTSKAKTSPILGPDGRARFGTTVRVSWELHDFIMKHGVFGETLNDVLTRLLKIS